MKKLILFHILLIPISTFCQIFDYSSTDDKLKIWEEITDTQEKIEFVNNFKETLDSGSCIFLFSKLEEFYIIDIDRDGLKDVFFSGSCMLDGDVTAVYRFNGKTFEEMILVIGIIRQVSDYNSGSPFSFTINNHACCMGFTNVFERYVLILENGQYKYKLQSREDYPYDTEFPKTYLKKPIAFRTIKEEYKLRFSPMIDDTTLADRPYEAYGNTIWTYPANSIGVAIAEKEDETGRIWWFVKMNNKTATGLEEFTSHVGDNNKEPTYSLGWMSSRFLEIIE